MEEVFDLNDVTDLITDTKNYFPINFSTTVTEETNTDVPEKKIEEEMPEVPIKLEEPSPVVPGVYTFDIIEAYTGEAFAAF